MMIRNKEKNFVSAVVYIRNNEAELKDFLSRLNSTLSANFEKFEVICVNDQSTDGSVQRIKDMEQEFGNTVVSIINMGYYQGREVSMNAGIDMAIGDFVFEFDSTWIDYDMDLVMQVYYHSIRDGFDIVSAAPKKINRTTVGLFYRFFNRFAKYHINLRPETFRILSRRSINRVHSLMVAVPYRKAVYARCGLKLDTLVYEPLVERTRVKDRAMSSYRNALALDSLVLFTDVPGWFVNIMILATLLSSLVFFIYTLYMSSGGRSPEWWMVGALMLSLALCGLFTCLAIIIKYLSLIEGLIFKRQKYVIESIEKIAK